MSVPGSGSVWEPSGRSRVMQRKSGARRSTTLRHRLAFTSRPWTKTMGAPLPAWKYAMRPPPGRSRTFRSPSAGDRQAALDDMRAPFHIQVVWTKTQRNIQSVWKPARPSPSGQRPPARPCCAAARELFSERGYAGVGTEEIVPRARVTRGALYHHFADKQDLFRAVHEQMEGEIVAAIAARMDGPADPLELLKTGTRASWTPAWTPRTPGSNAAGRALGARLGRVAGDRHALRHGARDGGPAGGRWRRAAAASRPCAPSPTCCWPRMGEAALMIANSTDPQSARDEMEPALLEMLEGLRP